MVKQTPYVITLLSLLLLLCILTEVEGANKSYGVYDSNSVKLFVFGDSYLDTGNFLFSTSYLPPYGMTFPGKPAGRFSNGYVLTDYIASFLKIPTPAPNTLRSSSDLRYGINFAYGGTGVFDTLTPGPNMGTQIDSLEQLIQQNVYTKSDLESSVALVSAAGNDYAAYFAKNLNILGLGAFTTSLVNQLTINLQRIHSLGINKIAVMLLEPLGCMPTTTMTTAYQTCVDTTNLASVNHNRLLLQAVQGLNQQAGKSVFVPLDIYNAFLSAIATMQKTRAENPTLMSPLQPCCQGSCGFVGYTVCANPELSFFWDILHPSQNGWYQVYTLLQPSLGQLLANN